MRHSLRHGLGLLVVFGLLAVLAMAVPASAAPAATSSLTARHCGHLCVKIDGQGLMPGTFVSIDYSTPFGPVVIVDLDHPIGADGEYHFEWQISETCQPSRDITRRLTVFVGATAADGSSLSDSVDFMIKFC
jgi:hypothetical protein